MIPIEAPRNYPEMLNRIAFFTFLFALVLSFAVPSPQEVLATQDWMKQLSNLNINFGFITVSLGNGLVAAGVALFCRIIKLHDRISNVLGIRLWFDIHAILIPLAAEAGVSLDFKRLEKVRLERSELMRKTFYRYASSTNPRIDSHDIIMALETWSWFWVLLEGVALGMGAFLWCLVAGAYATASWIALACMIAIILFAFGSHRWPVQNAKRQLSLILEDDARKADIKESFERALRD